MSKSKMTPGPWTVIDVDDGVSDKRHMLHVIDSTDQLVADCDVEGFLDTCEANARAIACLPELVEAARTIVNATTDEIAANTLRRILARIEGEGD